MEKQKVNEGELKHKFIEAINQEFGNLVMTPLANKCIEISKQYSDSKLEELENKIIEDLQFLADKAIDPAVKIAYESISITIVETHFNNIK